MISYINDDVEIRAVVNMAKQHGLTVVTRVNPQTGRQQTAFAAQPVGEWKRLHIHAKQVQA